MKKLFTIILFFAGASSVFAQGYGIVRKNYISTVFDSTLNMTIDILDSSTIRLGSINTSTGLVSNSGTAEYSLGINLTGATIDPYSNHYLISSGNNLLTFDMNNGTLVNSVPISGPFQTSAFQNYRFNPSDSVIYGLIPTNFSSNIRFGSLDPQTGQYALIGNVAYKNVYTLAGNAIDPHQMIYYYSAVDTLVGIDLYTGALYSETPIQLPSNAIFENFTYSCADTSIYGITRQNYISTVYDSLLQMFIDVYDSTTFRLSKIDPNTGVVTFISPANLGLGGSLSGSCFIDPNTMTYFFSTGTSIVGISLASGLITSSQPKIFQGNEMYFDMMRSNANCLNATKIRLNSVTGIFDQASRKDAVFTIQPNPANQQVTIRSSQELLRIEVMDLSGKTHLVSNSSNFDVSSLTAGVYIVRGYDKDGSQYTDKLLVGQP